MQNPISNRARDIAAEEVRSLLSAGYRSYGALRLKERESYFLRHLGNGNKAKVILQPESVDLYVNGIKTNSTPVR